MKVPAISKGVLPQEPGHLGAAFFERDPVTCARELIGTTLVWGRLSGRVVESEAYCAVGDPACHTHHRPSARRFIASHPPGTAYVYLNYGRYWLLNVLVRGGAMDGFVLIRALEPLAGLTVMERRRGTTNAHALCAGPGRLSMALGITGADHGRSLVNSPTRAFHPAPAAAAVVACSRIGISTAVELPWRFLEHPNRYVSRPPTQPHRKRHGP